VDSSSALYNLLLMLGVPSHAIPEGVDQRAAKWRSELAGRRVLLVLDNAASAAQVRPLLPGTSDCLVLVTSRRRLGLLDGAAPITLDVLPPDDALDLLDVVVGDCRVDARDAAKQVVELCGHLPLAIRIAATRLAHRRTWTLESLADRLQAETSRLDELAVEDRGVGSAFALSYAHLTPAHQRLFRLLGLHPGGSFDAYSVAALADLPYQSAEALLDDLVDAHLLRHTALGQYAAHDLIRSYARNLGAADGPGPAQRLHDYYLTVAVVANDLINREARRFDPVVQLPPAAMPRITDMDEAIAWLTRERRTLMAVAAGGDGWQLTYALRAFFESRGHYDDWLATHEQAMSRVEHIPRARAMLYFNMGALFMWTERYAEALEQLDLAIKFSDFGGEFEAVTLNNMGMIAHLMGRDRESIAYLQRALAIPHDNLRARALGWNNLGLAEGRLGHLDEALKHQRKGLALARRSRKPNATCGILLGIGETSLRFGLPAAEPFREAIVLAREGRFRIQEAIALDGLAHATGDHAYWEEALEIFDELGVKRADMVRRHLARPDARHCDLCSADLAPVDVRTA
jgi:tetratricopeptide (TPR) repeat protein